MRRMDLTQLIRQEIEPLGIMDYLDETEDTEQPDFPEEDEED